MTLAAKVDGVAALGWDDLPGEKKLHLLPFSLCHRWAIVFSFCLEKEKNCTREEIRTTEGLWYAML
jgi:hypothetical protein